MGLTGPAIGERPNTSGNGPTGTQNAFDMYYPDFTGFNGTWWFGSSYWATWPGELFGTEGAADMTFYGVGAQGNDAGLYTTGCFTGGGTLHFLLRRNELDLDGFLIASLSQMNLYVGGAYDATRLAGALAAGFPLSMRSLPLGDFYVQNVDIPVQHGGRTVFFQGFLTDPPLGQPPVDASNGLRAN